MRQRTLAAIALAVLLVSAGCAGNLGTTANQGAQSANTTAADRTIQVSAEGQVYTEPNQAVLRVGVTAAATDASTARERLEENVSEMKVALEEIDVDSDQLMTVDYDLSRDRYGSREGDRETFRARHTFRVTLNDTEKVGQVIEAAVTNGANDVQNVRYTISDDRRDELREQALRQAMDNARDEAEVLAEESDLTVEGPATIRSHNTGYGYARYEYGYATAGDASPESGNVAVTAQVNVEYNASA